MTDIKMLDSLMARYVQQFLGQGIMDTLSQSLTTSSEPSQADKIRYTVSIESMIDNTIFLSTMMAYMHNFWLLIYTQLYEI